MYLYIMRWGQRMLSFRYRVLIIKEIIVIVKEGKAVGSRWIVGT